MNFTKPFNSGLWKWMRKAARPLGGVDSLNPCCWRGERLHHHGGGVCWSFVLLWMDSWRHKLIVCKIWYKNNLKMRLMVLLFDPPMRAPYLPVPIAWKLFLLVNLQIVHKAWWPASSRHPMLTEHDALGPQMITTCNDKVILVVIPKRNLRAQD